MSHLHQLQIKLLNVLATNFTLTKASEAKEVEQAISDVVDEIFGALGGCDKCWGRGYLISGKTGDYCTCLRAQRLKEFVNNYV